MYIHTHLAQSLIIHKSAVGTAMVGDGVVGFPLVVADGSVRLTHLKFWDFNAMCSSRLSVCVRVCVREREREREIF